MKFYEFVQKEKIINEINKLENCDILTNFQKEIFKININEKINVPKLDKKAIKTALKFLTKKFNLKDSDFKYIGYTDLGMLKKGAKLLQFNIINDKHKSYKSTVAFKYGM